MASPRVDGVDVHPSGAIGYRTSNQSIREAVLNPASIKDWDDEELARGMRRAHDGTFRGRPPKVVPKVVHDEAMRRLLARGQQLFKESFEDAIETLLEVATSESAENKDKIKAAIYVIERIAGKTPEKIELSTGEKPFEILLGGLQRDLEDEGATESGDEGTAAAPHSSRSEGNEDPRSTGTASRHRRRRSRPAAVRTEGAEGTDRSHKAPSRNPGSDAERAVRSWRDTPD
jgi:hypothetical protein